jgi:hypothetical protein
MAAQQLPAGEQARWSMREDERAAAYSPLTEFGSREGKMAVQDAYPALSVQRAQYGALPGDEKDYGYLLDSAQRGQVYDRFDVLKDAVLASRPWDRKAARAVEDARYRALEAVKRPGEAGDATWQGEYLKAVAAIQGQTVGDAEERAEYRPLSLAGATPKEALQIRRDEAMRFIKSTEPRLESFTGEDGQPDYDGWNAAVADWRNNLPTVAMGVPQVAQVFAKASGEGMGDALASWLGNLTGEAVDAYRRRNDSAMEAFQRAYFDGLYQPMMAKYRELSDAGDKEAWDKTIGAVGEIRGADVIPAIRRMYGDRFTAADLEQLKGLTMPPATEIMRSNMSDMAARKDKARSAFWDYFRNETPPGGDSYKLREIPLVSAALDQSSRATLTTEQYKLALMMARGWVAETYGGAVPPEVKAEWAQARAEKVELDSALLARVGRDGMRALQQYEMAPDAASKEAIRRANPVVGQALTVRYQFSRSRPVFAKYYRTAAKRPRRRSRRR